MTIRKSVVGLALIMLLLMLTGVQAQQTEDNPLYLPVVMSEFDPIAENRVLNIPYLDVEDIIETRFQRMSVFWFGQIQPDTNYIDVRVGYNNTEMVIHTNIFDRRLWYNKNSNGTELTIWDAVTLTLHKDGNTTANVPEDKSYQFTGQLLWWEFDQIEKYKASYQGNGTDWVLTPIPFTTRPGWRGDALNDNLNDHGWSMIFRIPFSSLGLSGPPQEGAKWRLGLVVHDRDHINGINEPLVWPDAFSIDKPMTWGLVRFGLPVYSVPDVSNIRQTTIQHKLNGISVPDAAVGGGMTCGAGLDPWTEWGNKNYAGADQFNIQNQSDVSDWVCFSKYYVTFPIDSIPPGKVIRSAKLILHQYGGSNPAEAYASLVQVATVGDPWEEKTLTWNNAPQLLENASQGWVQVFTGPIVWPGAERTWDLSRAVAQAYTNGGPLQLVLYSADSAMHSGKYFTSSDTGDWNAAGRPTLVVEWGDPQ